MTTLRAASQAMNFWTEELDRTLYRGRCRVCNTEWGDHPTPQEMYDSDFVHGQEVYTLEHALEVLAFTTRLLEYMESPLTSIAARMLVDNLTEIDGLSGGGHPNDHID